MFINRTHTNKTFHIDTILPPGQRGFKWQSDSPTLPGKVPIALFSPQGNGQNNTTLSDFIFPNREGLVFLSLVRLNTLANSAMKCAANTNGSFVFGTNGNVIFVSTLWDCNYGEPDHWQGLPTHVNSIINKSAVKKSIVSVNDPIPNFQITKSFREGSASQATDKSSVYEFTTECLQVINDYPQASLIATDNMMRAAAVGVMGKPSDFGFNNPVNFLVFLGQSLGYSNDELAAIEQEATSYLKDRGLQYGHLP